MDKRLVVDNGAIGVSADNSTVNITDGGSVKAAFDFGTNLAAGGLKGYEDLLALTSHTFDALNSIQAANNSAVSHISETSTEAILKATSATVAVTDTNRYLVAGGLAVVGIVAIKVWGK